MNLVDLSCHILDGTGCGPESYAESLEMCQAAAAEGVRTLVATPRWVAGSLEPPLPFDECRRKIRRLQGELGGKLALKLGFLLPFSPKLLDLVDRYGSDLALGGKRHLLISLSSLHIQDETEVVWAGLIDRGFTPVIAQPECNPLLRRNHARVAGWVALGVKLQVNAASVVGGHGREVRHTAISLLRAHERSAFVASNARSARDRAMMIGSAKDELRSHLGVQQATRFLRDVPTAIVDDAAITLEVDSPKAGGRLPAFLSALNVPKALKKVS
jgi:protein-tyrosine phosphatase